VRILRSIQFLIILTLTACLTPSQKSIKSIGVKKGIFAKITTEKGIIIAKLEFEKAPLTVANFIGLAQGLIPNTFKKSGEPFYDGLKFHRVIKGYMVIGGCPKGDGSGNPGYFFNAEFHKDLKHDKQGILTMENAGALASGSQFIITMRPTPVLDNKNSIFGIVISGLETVNAIQQGETILKIEIIKLGKKAKAFNPIEVFEKNGFSKMLRP